MKNAFFSRALPAFTMAAVALASLPASASLYNSLVVFGDSLSDDGNNALTIGTLPGQVITGNTYAQIARASPLQLKRQDLSGEQSQQASKHFYLADLLLRLSRGSCTRRCRH
jgi:phospholipase/lecithinase/hemolysin